MEEYPIRIHPKIYRGRDKKKLQKLRVQGEQAKAIEAYINKEMKRCEQKFFSYQEIAYKLNLSLSVVTNL